MLIGILMPLDKYDQFDCYTYWIYVYGNNLCAIIIFMKCLILVAMTSNLALGYVNKWMEIMGNDLLLLIVGLGMFYCWLRKFGWSLNVLMFCSIKEVFSHWPWCQAGGNLCWHSHCNFTFKNPLLYRVGAWNCCLLVFCTHLEE